MTYRKPQAILVYLGMEAAASMFLTMIFTVLAVYYVRTVGMNPLQLVLVGTVLEGTVFLFEIPTGVVADTFSRRLSVIIGQLLIGLCYLIEGLVPLFGAILLAEAIRGLGTTFVSGALEAWIADEVGPDRVGRVYLRAGQVGQVGSFAGIVAGAGLATLQLNLPIVLGGGLMMGLALALVLVMPEHRSRPAPATGRRSREAMGDTFRAGVQAARHRPLVLMLLVIGVAFGASSEGFDRLREAHFLANFTFPELGGLEPVVWFGILRAGTAVLSLVTAETAIRRLNTGNQASMARALFVLTACLMAGVMVFGLAGSFALAVGAFWLVSLLRSVYGPLAMSWLNQHIDSRSRATVLSLVSQADALGQVAGGPGIGLIGTVRSLRAAMVAAAALLSPAVALYGRALGPKTQDRLRDGLVQTRRVYDE